MTAVSDQLYDQTLQPLDIGLTRGGPGPGRDLPRRLRRWAGTHRVDLAVVAVLLLLGGLVHALGMYSSPARFDDEGTYTAYAWAVEYRHALSHYTYWYAHPPLGWIQISAWTTLTDGFGRAPYAVAAAREFMLVCKLAAIPLVYLLGRRLGFARWAAALGVGLFAFSPLAVYFTRAALLDNIVTPWLVASFALAASPRRSVRAAIASGLCCAVAVLSKETALLYLPAVLLLLWQHADRRNRRFTVVLFLAFFGLVCALYPTYALVKNELLNGPGHVSLQWAVQWQLFDRTGSGSIFDPHSTAHAVIRSWWDQDPWLVALGLAAVLPGLVLPRTRAVAVALALQLVQLLRNGYLPYPYVIAMIPFAALTVAGVLDGVWRLTTRAGDRVIDLRDHYPQEQFPKFARRSVQVLLVAGLCWLLVAVGSAWAAPLRDLRTNPRDAGKAQAEAWVEEYVPHGATLVVDDSYWVDLVRAGYPSDRVIWFTKLDVDPDVHLAGWPAIDYLVLDEPDDLSLHVTADGLPSGDTTRMFPTVGKALAHSRLVARFGTGRDAVTVRAVDPLLTKPSSHQRIQYLTRTQIALANRRTKVLYDRTRRR